MNLREAKKSLWSIDVTLRNEGNAEIRKGDFDSDAPVRISVKDAQVVDRPTVTASNEYLRQNVKLSVGQNSVAISPVIIEPEDGITIKFLILGAEGVRPQIEIFGKIAGIRTLTLKSIDSSSNSKPRWQELVGPNVLWVQIARVPIYFFGFFLVVGMSALFGVFISSPFSRRRERREKDLRIQEIRRIRSENAFDQKMNGLADEYIENGIASISSIARDVSRAETRDVLYTLLDNGCDPDTAQRHKNAIGPILKKGKMDRLSELRLIRVEDEKPVGLSDLSEALRHFCRLIGKDPDELAEQADSERFAAVADEIAVARARAAEKIG